MIYCKKASISFNFLPEDRNCRLCENSDIFKPKPNRYEISQGLYMGVQFTGWEGYCKVESAENCPNYSRKD